MQWRGSAKSLPCEREVGRPLADSEGFFRTIKSVQTFSAYEESPSLGLRRASPL